jgi:proton-dependent oligopeptide transporter, POT family
VLEAAAGRSSRILEHPRGLWILTGTELWDRISFHGMQALLTLYMVDYLLIPGHIESIAGFATFRAAVESITGPLSIRALAAQTFGIYVGLVYFTPVLGGALGDRLIGRRAGVVSGALLLTTGHFCMAFDVTFLLALLLLILGAGLLRGNLAPQVTALYEAGDRRQADAFQLFFVGINIGAFIAPIATGSLAVVYGWHFGFGFAGIGMLIGLVIYLAGQRLLPPDRARTAAEARQRLTPGEWRRLMGLGIVFIVATGFWVAQTQVWNVYNLWLRDYIDLKVGSFTVPVPWLQSLDGVSPVLFLPMILALWRVQAARGTEPDELGKIAIGCLIFGGATTILAVAPWTAGPGGRASLFWPIVFHLSSNIGWLFFTPTAEALFASRAPVSLRGTLIGANAATVFFASLVSGRIGGLYERLSPAAFWLVHAGIIAGGGVAVLVLRKPLRRLLAG